MADLATLGLGSQRRRSDSIVTKRTENPAPLGPPAGPVNRFVAPFPELCCHLRRHCCRSSPSPVSLMMSVRLRGGPPRTNAENRTHRMKPVQPIAPATIVARLGFFSSAKSGRFMHWSLYAVRSSSDAGSGSLSDGEGQRYYADHRRTPVGVSEVPEIYIPQPEFYNTQRPVASELRFVH